MFILNDIIILVLFWIEYLIILMNDINNIYNLIKDYKVISFDVFDTLIIRDVKKPTDIFRLS